MKKNQLILILILSIFTNFGFAQKTIKDSINLTEIVVTGSKTGISRKLVPLTVSQITKNDIENTGQINILPTLNAYVPGIFVTERSILGFGVGTGGSGGISMRGLSSAPNTGVLVLIDGHPQYQGIFGHPLADAYVASDVEKVEVIRGPGSLLYGSNAMAGVINIISRKIEKEGISGSLGAAYGSYATQKYFGTISFKKDKLGIFASVNHDQTDGIRVNTDFNITNGYTKISYELNKNIIINADVSIAAFKGNDNGRVWKNPTLAIEPYSVEEIPAPFGIDILRGKASLSIENKNDKIDGALKIYHNFGEHTLTNGFHSTDRNSGVMLYQTFRLFENNSITVGTDFKQYGGIVNQLPIKDSLITINELAAYAYAQQKLFEKLTLSAGLRIEINSKFGSELIPMAGLSYSLHQNTTIKTSLSKGFRSPTIMELYMNSPVPNPNLDPERMMNYEISWLQTFLNDKIKTELTVFNVVGNNMIIVTGVFPTLKKENVGSFNNKGIEFSAKYALNKNIFLHANYSYVNLSKAVLAAPRQQFNVSANFKHKIWNLNVSTQYIEKLYTFISPNPAIAAVIEPNYLLLNARLSARPLKKLEVFFAANNLLNAKYEINYGYPMPGIYYNTGINFKF